MRSSTKSSRPYAASSAAKARTVDEPGSIKARLLSKIADRSAVTAVIGLGYVGLPLAMEFCDAGFTVIGYDITQSLVDQLMRGTSHIQDVPSSQLAAHVKSGKFTATTDESAIARADTISIAVPTPLAKTRDPDMSYVIAAAEAIARHAHKGMLIVLESTTYPGTTRDVMQPRLEKLGLVIGSDVFLAFSPERVDPGNPVWHTKNTPKVLGGITPACTQVAAALYATCIDHIVPVSSPEAAELTKLLENTFRHVNIALVNELAMFASDLGVDIWEAIAAASTKPFGFMTFTPGPGVGGHCLPVDPSYLSWKVKQSLGTPFRFVELANDVNDHMPDYVGRRIAAALNRDRKAVNGSRILVLGLTYKRNSGDVRESPGPVLCEHLSAQGAEVRYVDPHLVPGQSPAGAVPVHLSQEELHAADIVVVVTDHDAFDWELVAAQAGRIIDTRHCLPDAPNVEYL